MKNNFHTSIPVRSGGKIVAYTLVDGDYDGEYFSQFKWYLNPNGYAYRNIYTENKTKFSMLHKEVCKTPKGLWVDHINRNKLDNRSCNLRWVTPSESALNRKDGIRANASGYRGVHFNDKSKSNITWDAVINGKRIGRYKTPIEAAEAYDNAAQDMFGELATINFLESHGN